MLPMCDKLSADERRRIVVALNRSSAENKVQNAGCLSVES